MTRVKHLFPSLIINILCVLRKQPPPNGTWNGPLTGYDVAYRQVSSDGTQYHGDWQLKSVISPTQLSIVVDELSLSVLYEIKVRTCNAIGSSAYSSPFTLYTELRELDIILMRT